MVTLFRWLVRLTVGLIVAGVALIALVWYFAIRSLPAYNATYDVAGITSPVEIVRSTEDVPHIFGKNDHDVFFALGLAHAQDRLFQMNVLRRAAQGRLAEIYGAGALPADDLARRLGLFRNAVASVEAQDAPTRAALAAYSEGVNAWIQQVNLGARGRGAPEFFLFPDEISYWEPADSLAILKLLAASSTTQLRREVLRARLSLAAPERGQEVVATTAEPPMPAYATLFPDARFAGVERHVPHPDWNTGLAGYLSPSLGASANGWAVAPRRTAAGGALLANDPQFALTAPGLWYLARLELASGGVIGGTIPGIPAVLSGRSADLAWGITPAQIDDQDLFIEEVQPGDPDRYRGANGWVDFTTRNETIRVKGEAARTITLRESENGPILPAGQLDIASILPAGHVAALAWTGGQAGDTSMTALMSLMQSRTREDAAQALVPLVAPALNVTLADKNGVGQVLAGALPERSPDSPIHGRMPQPGWSAVHRWLGVNPAPTTLTDLRPEGGVVATTGAAQPGQQIVGFDRANPYRQDRLRHLIDSREVHSRDSFIAAQIDVVSPDARALLPVVAAELWFTDEPAPQGTPERQRQDALSLLANWDGTMSEHLPEPLIYSSWMRALQERIVQDEIGPLTQHLTEFYPEFIERVFRNINGAGEWCDIRQSTPVETCTQIARQALDAALLELTDRFGPDLASWRWGDVHRARHVHPALGDLRGLSYIVNLVQPTSGGDSTIALAGMLNEGTNPYLNVTGATYRGVYDLADPDSSVFIISTGQSGHPLSRHYDDMSELWRRGEYVRMSLDPDLARAAATGVTRLEPVPE
ncbi:penicillin acylase family protein [Paracoccus litorisediminis]|uniref:Penicillin acylase family protein n=1 Tax=Paracoccus litorisediminis TaxID=2006130 RepID=A0A844HEG2_9RHOB|nr:penicillin acylase family protein [Paracoccus litorisediminis]MTH57670.1 penicillin acylase family protein [Paracoccus litorisediminis]